MFDLTGKKALVTGATGGLGSEIARALHGAGAHVAASARRSRRAIWLRPRRWTPCPSRLPKRWVGWIS